MEELKPCPFCRGKAEIHERFSSISKYAEKKNEIPKNGKFIRSTHYPGGKTYYEYREKEYVPRCIHTECIGRLTRTYNDLQSAILAWNRRADHD